MAGIRDQPRDDLTGIVLHVGLAPLARHDDVGGDASQLGCHTLVTGGHSAGGLPVAAAKQQQHAHAQLCQLPIMSNLNLVTSVKQSHITAVQQCRLLCAAPGLYDPGLAIGQD